MSTSKKYAISLIFAVGIFACAAGASRLAFSFQSEGDDDDYTYMISFVLLSDLIESIYAILVLCVPAVPNAIKSLDLAKVVLPLNPWSSTGRLRRREQRTSTVWSPPSLVPTGQNLETDSGIVPLLRLRTGGSLLISSIRKVAMPILRT
ncbi:hypothetical protein F4804DRAFT_327540 [Jackrogersella minutella]|nr:hypothetical protein F4804DRAFT_327540 [Jackrogersella minutella]